MSSTRVKSNIKVPRVSFHLDLTKAQKALKERADQVISKSQINSDDSWNFDRVEVRTDVCNLMSNLLVTS